MSGQRTLTVKNFFFFLFVQFNLKTKEATGSEKILEGTGKPNSKQEIDKPLSYSKGPEDRRTYLHLLNLMFYVILRSFVSSIEISSDIKE